MIVVIDTNVYISALQFSQKRGIPIQAVAKAIKTDVIVTCDEIEAEIARILVEKFQWSNGLVHEALAYIGGRAIRVRIHGKISVCRDPDDNKFLECAERAGADLIVTGDKDLLAIGVHGCTRIVTPAEYLKLA